MARTTAFEFQRQFGHFQRLAQLEPIEITWYGRHTFVLILAEQYDWLKAAVQRTHRTPDAAEVITEAVERAEMSPAAALDEFHSET